jgi:hypothetical protein
MGHYIIQSLDFPHIVVLMVVEMAESMELMGFVVVLVEYLGYISLVVNHFLLEFNL